MESNTVTKYYLFVLSPGRKHEMPASVWPYTGVSPRVRVSHLIFRSSELLGSVWSCYIPAPPSSARPPVRHWCQLSCGLQSFHLHIFAIPDSWGCMYIHIHMHIYAARVWDTPKRNRQTKKQTSQAVQLSLSPFSCPSFHSLSSLPLTLSYSCTTYHSAVLSEEQRACHRRGCVRVAHIVQGSAARTTVLPLQWSGWRGKEGGKEPKTSGAQLHWLSYQKHLFSPLCSFPLLSSGRYFMDTSQLLITAGDSQRGCGFWPTHVHEHGPRIQTYRHNKETSIGLPGFGCM